MAYSKVISKNGEIRCLFDPNTLRLLSKVMKKFHKKLAIEKCWHLIRVLTKIFINFHRNLYLKVKNGCHHENWDLKEKRIKNYYGIHRRGYEQEIFFYYP